MGMLRIGDIETETPVVAVPKLGVMVEGCVFPWFMRAETYSDFEISNIQKSPLPEAVKIIQSIGNRCFNNRVHFISRIREKDRDQLEHLLTAIGLTGTSAAFDQPLEYLSRDRTAAAACKHDLSHVVSTDHVELGHMSRIVPHRILLDTPFSATGLQRPGLLIANNWQDVAKIVQQGFPQVTDKQERFSHQ